MTASLRRERAKICSSSPHRHIEHGPGRGAVIAPQHPGQHFRQLLGDLRKEAETAQVHPEDGHILAFYLPGNREQGAVPAEHDDAVGTVRHMLHLEGLSMADLLGRIFVEGDVDRRAVPVDDGVGDAKAPLFLPLAYDVDVRSLGPGVSPYAGRRLSLRSSVTSQQASLLEARVAAPGDNDMVEHLDPHEPACVDQPAGYRKVVIRRLGVVRRVVVDEYDRRGVVRQRVLEDLAGMHETRVKVPTDMVDMPMILFLVLRRTSLKCSFAFS